MAPELVQLPDVAAERVADQAQRLGAAAIVRSMERLGEMLVEMRHAPDPRLLLDIALVQLTHEAAGSDLPSILARLERLEKGGAPGAGAAAAATPPIRPAPVDPATGRAALGGRARRDPASAPAAADAAPPVAPAGPEPMAPTPAAADTPAAAASPAVAAPSVAAQPSPSSSSGGGIAARVSQAWQAGVLPTLKPMARALFSAGHIVGERDGVVEFGLPNETHRSRCEDFKADVEKAISAQIGAPVALRLIVDTAGGSHDDSNMAAVVPLRPSGSGTSSASVAVTPPPTADEDIDISDLVDAPPGSVKSPEDRLAEAFPGSVFLEDPR